MHPAWTMGCFQKEDVGQGLYASCLVIAGQEGPSSDLAVVLVDRIAGCRDGEVYKGET